MNKVISELSNKLQQAEKSIEGEPLSQNVVVHKEVVIESKGGNQHEETKVVETTETREVIITTNLNNGHEKDFDKLVHDQLAQFNHPEETKETIFQKTIVIESTQSSG